jgi:hypothetical protein
LLKIVNNNNNNDNNNKDSDKNNNKQPGILNVFEIARKLEPINVAYFPLVKQF